MKVLLLASGAGSLARAILEARITDIEIVGLISDKECGAISMAHEFALSTAIVEIERDRKAWDQNLISTVGQYNPDLVVSVGFMRILAPEFLSQFPTINTHPALLPNFPGAHAVRDALAAGATQTGCTVHWVDEGVDTGPVIAQKTLPILESDTEISLHERIKILERSLIVEVLTSLAAQGIPENR